MKKKIEGKKEKETVVIANRWFTGLFHGIRSLHSMVRLFHLIVILLHNMVSTIWTTQILNGPAPYARVLLGLSKVWLE